MVRTKSADGANAHCPVIEVVMDDDGPALMVDGERKATTADDLEVVGRRALAIAASLRGSLRPAEPTDIDPFRPIWPGRLPVESGVPPELVSDPDLTPAQKFLWFGLWLLVPHLTGRLELTERCSWIGKWLGLNTETVRRGLRRLDEVGWATVCWRAPPPSSQGEFRVTLHLRRRLDAPGAVIETTAEASSATVKSDE